MKFVSFISYFFAGIFFTNSAPHLLVATSGRRNITPFGKNSSPSINLLWSAINVACGYLLVRFADSRAVGNKVDSKGWQIPYELGCFSLSVFGVLYSWFTARGELAKGVQ